MLHWSLQSSVLDTLVVADVIWAPVCCILSSATARERTKKTSPTACSPPYCRKKTTCSRLRLWLRSAGFFALHTQRVRLHLVRVKLGRHASPKSKRQKTLHLDAQRSTTRHLKAKPQGSVARSWTEGTYLEPPSKSALDLAS